MAAKLAFKFTAQVVRVDQGMPYHALPVPADVAAAWKKARVRRLIGTINGESVNRALMNHADGGSFFIVSRDLMKTAGIVRGKPVRLDFRPDPAPHRPEVPAEFAEALAQDPAARARWDTFTPGRRRSLLVYITGAKTEATRIKRSVELARLIRTHSLYGDRQKSRGPAKPPGVRTAD